MSQMKVIHDALDRNPTRVTQAPKEYIGDSDWYHADIVVAADSYGAMTVGIAEHRSDNMFLSVWRRDQSALILEGEMRLEDIETGERYALKKGDVVMWNKGLKAMIGGHFKAYGVGAPAIRRFEGDKCFYIWE